MRTIGRVVAAVMLVSAAVAAHAQTAPAPLPGDPTLFARSADVQAAIAEMARTIKPTEEMIYRPYLALAPYTVALEYWVRPKQAAAHLKEAELVYVVDGAGTLVSGGTLADRKHWYDETDGGRVEGGTTRALKPGDVFFVPEGVPHWFGITGGRLVLLTIHVPRPLPAAH